MTNNELITISGLLDYLYSRFAVTYIMCFLGVVISKVLKIATTNKNKEPTPLNAANMLLQSVLITVIICAAQDYLNIKSFNIYVLICIFAGIWSPVIVQCITNLKLVEIFIVNVTKKTKDPLISAIGDIVDQIENEKKNDEKEKCSNRDKQGDGTN